MTSYKVLTYDFLFKSPWIFFSARHYCRVTDTIVLRAWEVPYYTQDAGWPHLILNSPTGKRNKFYNAGTNSQGDKIYKSHDPRVKTVLIIKK